MGQGCALDCAGGVNTVHAQAKIQAVSTLTAAHCEGKMITHWLILWSLLQSGHTAFMLNDANILLFRLSTTLKSQPFSGPPKCLD